MNSRKEPTQTAPLTIYITSEAYQRLMAYTNIAKGEISGLGLVEPVNGHALIITEILLFDQIASGGSTDIDRLSIVRYMENQMVQGNDLSNLKLWWHTHNTLGTWWSVGDGETIEGFNNTWMLSLETNKNGDMICRLDFYDPVHAVISCQPPKVIFPKNEELDAAIEEEINNKVRYKAKLVKTLVSKVATHVRKE